jgi:stage III sporulation protein SpoIIIAA
MSNIQTLLDQAEAAIIDILQNGVEVQIGNRRYRMENLKELRAFRDGLKDELSKEVLYENRRNGRGVRVPVRFNA